MFVTLEKQVSEIMERFEAKIRHCDEVIDCYRMTGRYDYIVRVVSRDLPSYDAFLKEKLTRLSVGGRSQLTQFFRLKRLTLRDTDTL